MNHVLIFLKGTCFCVALACLSILVWSFLAYGFFGPLGFDGNLTLIGTVVSLYGPIFYLVGKGLTKNV